MHCDIIRGVKATKGKRRKDEMEIKQTSQYVKWFDGLKDRLTKMRIARRVKNAARGEYGDAKPVGENVSELRFHFGPGYRVYFTERHGIMFILLAGGDKSTQRKDIARAKELARNI